MPYCSRHSAITSTCQLKWNQISSNFWQHVFADSVLVVFLFCFLFFFFFSQAFFYINTLTYEKLRNKYYFQQTSQLPVDVKIVYFSSNCWYEIHWWCRLIVWFCCECLDCPLKKWRLFLILSTMLNTFPVFTSLSKTAVFCFLFYQLFWTAIVYTHTDNACFILLELLKS